MGITNYRHWEKSKQIQPLEVQLVKPTVFCLWVIELSENFNTESQPVEKHLSFFIRWMLRSLRTHITVF